MGRQFLLISVLFLGVCMTIQAKQVTVQVKVNNWYAPQHIELSNDVDIILVKHGWFMPFEHLPPEYKDFKDFLHDHPLMCFILEGVDANGSPLEIKGPRFSVEIVEVPGYGSGWLATWAYEIKLKTVSTSEFILKGLWYDKEGNLAGMSYPTYITVK